MAEIQLDDLICAIIFTYNDTIALFTQQHKYHRKTNSQTLIESLQNSKTLIQSSYSSYLARLGSQFADGDEAGRRELLEILARMQNHLIFLEHFSPNSEASAKFWSEAWDSSESTRLRTLLALKEQFDRFSDKSFEYLEESKRLVVKSACEASSSTHTRSTAADLPLHAVHHYLTLFSALDTLDLDQIPGFTAREVMLQAGIPENTLSGIWELAEIHPFLRVTRHNFCLAFALIQLARNIGEEAFESMTKGIEARLWLVECAEMIEKEIERIEYSEELSDEESEEEASEVDETTLVNGCHWYPGSWEAPEASKHSSSPLNEKASSQPRGLRDDSFLEEQKVRSADIVDWFGYAIERPLNWSFHPTAPTSSGARYGGGFICDTAFPQLDASSDMRLGNLLSGGESSSGGSLI